MQAALSATCGDNSEEDPPVPIPNTVVKLLSADDTWRVTSREIRTSLLFLYGPMVKWLRHRPFTAVTRVRVPVGSPLERESEDSFFYLADVVELADTQDLGSCATA